MAITLTKKVTSTWTDGCPTPGGLRSMAEIIHPFVDEMTIQYKTDGVYYELSDTSSYRLWTDETSAQQFADLVTTTAAEKNYTDYSYIITDI